MDKIAKRTKIKLLFLSAQYAPIIPQMATDAPMQTFSDVENKP